MISNLGFLITKPKGDQNYYFYEIRVLVYYYLLASKWKQKLEKEKSCHTWIQEMSINPSWSSLVHKIVINIHA